MLKILHLLYVCNVGSTQAYMILPVNTRELKRNGMNSKVYAAVDFRQMPWVKLD